MWLLIAILVFVVPIGLFIWAIVVEDGSGTGTLIDKYWK